MTDFASTGQERNVVRKAEQMCRQAQYYMGTVDAIRTEDRRLRVKITVGRRPRNRLPEIYL